MADQNDITKIVLYQKTDECLRETFELTRFGRRRIPMSRQIDDERSILPRQFSRQSLHVGASAAPAMHQHKGTPLLTDLLESERHGHGANAY